MVAENGDIYCTWIDNNGDWQKVKGECSAITTSTPATPGVNETPTPGVGTTQVAISIAQQAADAAQEAAQQAQRAQRQASQAQQIAEQIQEQVEQIPQAINITSVASIEDIAVDYGTDLSSLNLPTTINVTLSDNTNQTVSVTWDNGIPDYDANTSGTYTFSGILTFSGNITNTDNLTATVNITVSLQPVPAASEASELIQDAASSLLDGTKNFVSWIFGSVEIKSLSAGLFEPIKKLFELFVK